MTGEQKRPPQLTPYQAVKSAASDNDGRIQASYTGAPLIAMAMLAVADEIRDLTETLNMMRQS